MDVVFSVYIVKRGAVGAHVWMGESFRHEAFVFWVSPQYCILHESHCVMLVEDKRDDLWKRHTQSWAHDCVVA